MTVNLKQPILVRGTGEVLTVGRSGPQFRSQDLNPSGLWGAGKLEAAYVHS